MRDDGWRALHRSTGTTIVAAMSEHWHRVRRGRPVGQDIAELVGDYAQLAPTQTVLDLSAVALASPVTATAPHSSFAD